MVWLPVSVIFNVRTDVDECNCTCGLCEHRKRVCTECWLWGIDPLPHPGIEPVSVLRLASMSTELRVPPVELFTLLHGTACLALHTPSQYHKSRSPSTFRVPSAYYFTHIHSNTCLALHPPSQFLLPSSSPTFTVPPVYVFAHFHNTTCLAHDQNLQSTTCLHTSSPTFTVPPD